LELEAEDHVTVPTADPLEERRVSTGATAHGLVPESASNMEEMDLRFLIPAT